MATVRIVEMTQDELTTLIERTVDQRLKALLHEEPAALGFVEDIPDPRPLQAVFDSITRNIWTPPPSAKSSVELLRADRDDQ